MQIVGRCWPFWLKIMPILNGQDAISIYTTPIPTTDDPVIQSLLAPAPTLSLGSYDYFGSLESPGEARALVLAANLDADLPDSFARIGSGRRFTLDAAHCCGG